MESSPAATYDSVHSRASLRYSSAHVADPAPAPAPAITSVTLHARRQNRHVAYPAMSRRQKKIFDAQNSNEAFIFAWAALVIRDSPRCSIHTDMRGHRRRECDICDGVFPYRQLLVFQYERNTVRLSVGVSLAYKLQVVALARCFFSMYSLRECLLRRG